MVLPYGRGPRNERVYGDGTPDSQDITNTYLDNGYLFSRVTAVETSAENNTIDLEIRIIEDEPAYIRKVSIKGNDTNHILGNGENLFLFIFCFSNVSNIINDGMVYPRCSNIN